MVNREWKLGGNMIATALILLMTVPWLATFAGSFFGAKKDLKSNKQQGGFLGFAAGIMIAASVWSLIIPAFAELPVFSGTIVATVGFLLGCGLMLLLDKVVPHQHMEEDKPEGSPSSLSRPMLLVMAVALHNIPEGLALGVVMAGVLSGDLTTTSALVFGAGLALQNLPEGVAVTMPMRQAGISEKRCVQLGGLASLAEPVSALVGLGITVLLASFGAITMPILLSIAAGAMVFIVVEELIPASQAVNDGHSATYGFLLGFWIMAVMGIAGA